MSALIPLPNLVDPSRVSGARDQDDGTGEDRRRRHGPTAEELLDGLNQSQRRGGHPRGFGPARRRRRGLGQDPGAHPPDRLAAVPARRAPGLDPGDHVHQQGRRRDARAGRGARRRPRQDHVGLDVPLLVRAHPAPRDHAARLRLELLDLRRRRLAAADDAGVPRPRPRPEALHPARRAQLGQQLQERAARPRGGDREGGQPPRAHVRRVLRDLPGSAAGGQRARLRRPDHDDGAAAAGVPGGPRDLPPALPARARRRVPGHQPRAVHADPRAVRRWRRPSYGGRRPGRRRGRRDDRQHASTRAATSTPPSRPS